MNTIAIYDHLERIANLLRTDTRRTGTARGLHPVHMEALHYLCNCNRYSNTPAAVSDYLGLTKGTVSQTLAVLENAGFIEKRPDAKDRRVVHLQVTERGAALVAEAIPPKILQAAMAQTPEAEQARVLAELARVLRALQQANQLRTFGVCKTCRHHQIETEDTHRCGLTGEILQGIDIDQLCREHE
ncbi:MAG: MarR family winged helix-turn-helix transcriptional regulator [Candidatus Methylumidiphilus sp.]